jgi:transcriptional regulator with XRE-family HTH domain
MERAGSKLKRVREKLGLTYRHVEKASQQIAARRHNDEYLIALSRLADIENKGTVPTIFRLYSLCAIYRLDFNETLRWYEVDVEALASEALHIPLDATHPVHFNSPGPFLLPEFPEREIDFTQTTFLGQFLRRWGKNGLGFLGADARQHRYGLIGLDDWSMHPVLHPGSLVLIDETRRRIATGGWTSELDRPIYFVEHRAGYRCGWCSQHEEMLVVQAHPSSQIHPEIFPSGEVDIVGQVTGVAMLLESKERHPARSGASSKASQDL